MEEEDPQWRCPGNLWLHIHSAAECIKVQERLKAMNFWNRKYVAMAITVNQVGITHEVPGKQDHFVFVWKRWSNYVYNNASYSYQLKGQKYATEHLSSNYENMHVIVTCRACTSPV